MPEYPDIRADTQFGETAARQWQNAWRDLKAVAGMQVGEGLDYERFGEVMRLSLTPGTSQRQPKSRTVVLVEPFDKASMMLTVREVRYRDTPPTDPMNIQYTWHEDVFQAFPEPGTEPFEYEPFLWTEQVDVGTPEEPRLVLKEPQVSETVFLRARYKNDLWMVELPGERGGVELSRVLLAQDAGITDDHLVCRAIGSNPLDYTPIIVAKPWLLRKTPFASTGSEDIGGPVRGEVRYVYDAADSTKRTAYDINDPPGTDEQDRNKRTEMISPQYIPDILVDQTVTPGDELLIASASTGVQVKTLEPDPDNPEGPPISVLTPVSLVDITGMRGWTVVYEQL